MSQPHPANRPGPAVRLAWEHTHREALPALILLHKARQRQMSGQMEHLSALGQSPVGREVVFLPFFYDDDVRNRYLGQADYQNCWLGNMAWEQMHFACGRGYLLPDGEFARETVLHCAWGERFEELLIDHGIPKERIRITGHPRFDIYKHTQLLQSRTELAEPYGLDPDKDWVLVPYNFNMAYISAELRQSLQARGYNLSDEFIAGFAKARDAFTEMVRNLADEFPQTQFILRVHPAGYEAESIYQGESRTRENLFVIADYDIANWVRQAALTIVWNSTTSMECIVAGKPVVAYEPFPFSEVFDFDVNRIIPNLTKVSDIADVLRSLPAPGLSYDMDRFQCWYRHQDGKTADRLLDIVDEARLDPERYAVTRPIVEDPRLRAGNRLYSSVSKWPWGKTLLRTGFGVDRPPRHAPPPTAPLERAVTELSARPLLDYLR